MTAEYTPVRPCSSERKSMLSRKTWNSESSIGIQDVSIEMDNHARDSVVLARYSLSWKNITYSMKNKLKDTKTILSGVSGHVEPGEMLAIMGPSGSGKTTLLDVLADRVSSEKVHGDILVNGTPRTKDFRHISSYVAQEDSMMDMFTVEENLEFAAALGLPSFFNSSQKKKRIMRIVEEMGLKSCLKTRVGGTLFKGISGGQMRRLSIALCLISDPCVILLDEPTSGLDSSATYCVMTHVRKLAKSGRTIILTIHQPSSQVWHLFNNLLLLSEGKPVYYGLAQYSIAYFANQGLICPQYCNPADYFLSLINTDFDGHVDVRKLCANFTTSPQLMQVLNRIENSELRNEHAYVTRVRKHRANLVIQLWQLTKRNLINGVLNPGIYWIRVIMFFMVCSMIGALFFRNNKITDESIVPLLYFVHSFLVFMSVAVLPFLMMQRSVFIRERSNGLIDVFPFVLSNFISALPGVAIIALMCSVMVVFTVNLNGFWWFFLNLFLSMLVAESLMNVLGASTNHYIVGIAIAAGVFGMCMLCGGFMVTKDCLPVYLLGCYYAAFHHYSFQSFMYNQFHGNNELILEYYNLRDIDMRMDMAILAGYAVVLQVIFFFIVYFFHTGKK